MESQVKAHTKLSHPLGKTIAHNTKPAAKAAPKAAALDPEGVMKTLRVNTKLARLGGQAATSDVGGPAFTGRY